MRGGGAAVRGLLLISLIVVMSTIVVVIFENLRDIWGSASSHEGAIKLLEKIESSHYSDIIGAIGEHIASVVVLGFIVLNLRAFFSFARKSLADADVLIIGSWYVYRYTYASGKPFLLSDIWSVRRNISGNYIVKVTFINPPRVTKYRGRVVYNQRDRFNILLHGHDHEEQSLICFMPRIHVDRDPRMLGFGVGDDADYVLSSRPYLASRTNLPESHVKEVLKVAIQRIREKTTDDLVQFTKSANLEILSGLPVPEDCFMSSVDLRAWLHREGKLMERIWKRMPPFFKHT